MTPDRLPHEKGFHVSWDQLHRDARALAWRLQGEAPEGGWRAVVAITRGGMAPAMIVARELDIRTVDTISVKSYNHQTQSEPVVIKSPDMALVGDGDGDLLLRLHQLRVHVQDDLVQHLLGVLRFADQVIQVALDERGEATEEAHDASVLRFPFR